MSLLCGLVVLLVGCAHNTSTPQMPSTRLTETQVARIAATVAERAGYRLADYKAPTIRFNSADKIWSVYFFQKSQPDPDGHVCVWVDDQSRRGELIPSF